MPNNKAKPNLNFPSSHATACRLDPALEDRFESLATELQAHRDHGASLIDCPQCGYHASVEEQGFAPIFFSHCLLCRTKVRFVRIRCECGAVSAYDGAQHNKCVSCALPFTYGNLVAQNEPKTCGEESPEEYEGAQAHCHVCRKSQDSVFEFDHQWLCLNCLEEHRPPGTCEECETVQTGDLEDSFETGCMVCAGRLSWD